MRQVLAKTAVLLSALSVAACLHEATPPSGLDLSSTRPSSQGRYVVGLHPTREPVAVNQMHSWQIEVATASGQPVTHAKIAVDGGMPQHGHGFPTHPAVTKELGEGRYLLEGMKFSMPGWWEIKLKVESAGGTDQVTFNTVIALPNQASR